MTTSPTTPNSNPPDQADVNHNLRRALWTLTIIDAYAKEHGLSRAEAFPDVIANFSHGADHEKLDFDDILNKAKMHHREEVEGQGAI